MTRFDLRYLEPIFDDPALTADIATLRHLFDGGAIDALETVRRANEASMPYAVAMTGSFND